MTKYVTYMSVYHHSEGASPEEVYYTLKDLGWKPVYGAWDFAYDWGMLHHILPEQRHKYIEGVYRILNPKGKYLSVCFSEKDAGFGGSGKYRKTRLGTVLYFSSEG